jgi:beta-galactosidase
MAMNRREFVLSAGATALALQAMGPSSAFARPSAAGDEASTQMPLLLGADYYPDQTAEHLWEDDATQMAAMGITDVRIAEFAWALMEPKEGSFDFAWLDRAVKILNAHKIAVILGTPSAGPPPWLTQKYPEVLMVNDHGMTLSPGARRFTCPTNKTYRRLSLTIATQMAQHFTATPGVIGWQIDNELTLGSSGRCYCKYCRDGFADWLREKYKSLDAMNEAWGTIFWSNTYTDFSQIPVPLPSGAPTNPGLTLDYDRYQSHAEVSFLTEQLTMLRAACPKHFITTNNVGGVSDTINMRDLYRDLDFVSFDNYPGFFSVVGPGVAPGSDMPGAVLAPMVSFIHDFARSVKQGKPFLVMEEQSGKSGQPTFSPQPEPGQLRLWTYQAVAHGAMGINYFRWDTANFGAEEYWHGLIRHDRSHSPGFDEIQRTIGELKALGGDALHAPYLAEMALCVDSNSDWALTIQPGQPKLTYTGEVLGWYAAIASSHAGMDIVSATEDLSAYKVLFAPVMYIVSEQQARRIRSFVQKGGTFVGGYRLGVKDEASRIVATPLPGLLRDVMGVELIDYQPIYSEKQGVKFTGALAGMEADCHIWSDILQPKDGADVLATYTTGGYAGKAAITSHRFGKGMAIYVGAHLEPADLARVLGILMAEAGVKSRMQTPPGVEVATRGSGKQTWTYVLNHTAEPQTIQTESGAVTLEPYGVQVLRG